MHIHDERLPGEDIANVTADAKTVRLTLTSQHILTRRLDPGMSMFGDVPANDGTFPEGFSPDAIANFDAPYDDFDAPEADEDNFDENDEAANAADELYRRLEQLVEQITADDADAEDDTYVFKTLAQMRRTTDVDGNETIEIEYTLVDSMENTRTILAFTPAQNNRVSIIHDGPVMSSLVCERGVRHISAYRTPVMPFEVAVYAKRCDADLTYERGGYIELDYLVELRGMDIQRTRMTIDAICFE